MSFATVFTRASLGIHAPQVTVEAHISNGMPGFSIVGLPEAAVRESKDRVRSALLNTHFEFPAKRITINLAPADLPKEGSRFDLPIALSVLAATGQIAPAQLNQYECAGELALNGELRPIVGILPIAIACQQTQKKLLIPKENAAEAAILTGSEIYAARHLLEICDHFSGQHKLTQYECLQNATENILHQEDFNEVKGQKYAKRALEIAAAGGHSMLMIGPPGTGKSMLASRLPSILPPLSNKEAVEVASIYSISGKKITTQDWFKRPFRAPHHSASAVALVGGGSPPRPGEISLAHRGILFLDELPEFDRRVLESLREPIETGNIVISRAARQAEFPARFQLIAAMNPCPCGYYGDPKGRCHCTDERILRYKSRLSGPLLDRIDLQIQVMPLSEGVLQSIHVNGETSQDIKTRVLTARKIQLERNNCLNAHLSGKNIESLCYLGNEEKKFLEMSLHKLDISMRAFHRILRVARTIADLAQSESIAVNHLAEALSYRSFDRR